ncbi:transcriptional regulator [Methylobacterium platani]|uniref:transcriptional regulator n=1 Tax=Methylobacterium platani TaxID=427683 RepID=UPI0009E25E65|nr:Cro/CI family transcriptional regulator [Methylobacterium platani]
MTPDEALNLAIRCAGSRVALAKRLGISSPAVDQWVKVGRCPKSRALEVEQVTGVPRYLLRPDLDQEPSRPVVPQYDMVILGS